MDTSVYEWMRVDGPPWGFGVFGPYKQLIHSIYTAYTAYTAEQQSFHTTHAERGSADFFVGSRPGPLCRPRSEALLCPESAGRSQTSFRLKPGPSRGPRREGFLCAARCPLGLLSAPSGPLSPAFAPSHPRQRHGVKDANGEGSGV